MLAPFLLLYLKVPAAPFAEDSRLSVQGLQGRRFAASKRPFVEVQEIDLGL